MIHAVTLLVSLAGLACLALSMERHQKELVRRTIPRQRRLLLRCLGLGLVALALLPAIKGLGPNLGPVAWSGHVILAAATVFFLLLIRRRQASGG